MIEVDRSVCAASGMCALTAPDVFDQDDDGVVVVRADPVAEHAESVRLAVDLCPSGALRWRFR
ncbi:ferredoxin [Saccharomonospora cyanea]|uniref:Ferredoxin n=1 Tax=Saccharomonospora cyanea NA-134 TaxID=882082 RepID=H5XEW6_9PSEU|nr:ferredoxin [Saccharomonospora cyanea]EHR60360.1 ferredoxin [Saccharomonospora cyanea NA-134]